MDDLFDRFKGAACFTKIDLTQGYHQLRLAAEDVPKTSFRTHCGHFEFLVMAFGLCNAPASFMYLMNTVLQQFINNFVIVFLDDILIYSRSKQDHLKHVEQVLQKLREHKLYAREHKCEFLRNEVEYLGHKVSARGLEVCQNKVAKILD